VLFVPVGDPALCEVPPGCCPDEEDGPAVPVGVFELLPEVGPAAWPTVLPGARGPIQRIEGITGSVGCDGWDAPPDGLGGAVDAPAGSEEDPDGALLCDGVVGPVEGVLVGGGFEAVWEDAEVVGDVEPCQWPSGGDPEWATGGGAGWDDVGDVDDVSVVVGALLGAGGGGDGSFRLGGGGTDAGIPGMLGAGAVVDGDVLGVAAVVDGAGVLRQPCLLLPACTNRCWCGADTASLCKDPSGAESTQCRPFSLALAP
jgi:hypothetical protein